MTENDHVHYRIKPFVCSTDEFKEERDILSASIYPKLKEICESRGASFSPYNWDLRLSQDRLDSGLPLQLALDCITAASPFFLCIIGNKYGSYRHEGSSPLSKDASFTDCDWIERNILQAAEAGYSWLLDESYTSTSLFEFKVMQAAFFSEETSYLRFYIQDRGSSHVPDMDRFEKFKLQQLKAGLANRGLHVTYFRDSDELTTAVWKDWTAVIDELLPPLKAKIINVQLLHDNIHHEDFGNKKSEHFVHYEGVADCFQKLTDFSQATNDYAYNPQNRANKFERCSGIRLLRRDRESQRDIHAASSDQGSTSICALSGPRGCGKSALISQWLNECAMSIPANTKIIRHYAASGRMARNVAVFMKRCIAELRMAFTSNYDERLSFDDEYFDFGQLREAFLSALNLGPSLILFDGLDEICDCMGQSITEMKKLEWLADILPPACKIIVTATDSDLSIKALRDRHDTLFVSCPTINSQQSKRTVLEEYLTAFERSLTNAQKTQITSYKLSCSPIYLYMIAHELRDLNVLRDVSSHLDIYANLDSISTSTRDLWISLIKRWIRDYSWNRYQKEEKTTHLTYFLKSLS